MNNDFLIIPAIDLIHGECVRLYQGDYTKKTVYGTDPVETALRWQAEGARLIHIVDLDGAKAGHPVNLDTIERIARTIDIPIEVGGGVRSREDIVSLLDRGVQRIILGTSVIKDPVFAKKALAEFDEHIIIGLDARNGNVAVEGWTNTTTVNVQTVAQTMEKYGARRIIYTDISTDGTLEGPSLETLAQLAGKVSIPIIASGGIGDLGHILAIARLGYPNIEGCIVGKSLYTHSVVLKDAISALQETEKPI